MKKSGDPYLALLVYRTSPLKSGYSPAELLMGRSLRSTVPNLPATLEPKWSFLHDFRKKEKQIKSREKLNFDKRHNVRNLPSLKNDSCVYIDDGYYEDLRGCIVGPSEQPRSYVVDISGRSPVVRNRKFLKPCIENEGEQSTENLKPDN